MVNKTLDHLLWLIWLTLPILIKSWKKRLLWFDNMLSIIFYEFFFLCMYFPPKVFYSWKIQKVIGRFSKSLIFFFLLLIKITNVFNYLFYLLFFGQTHPYLFECMFGWAGGVATCDCNKNSTVLPGWRNYFSVQFWYLNVIKFCDKKEGNKMP